VKLFVGKTYGEITTEKIGDESFCYDCIFYSADLEKTFGEATEEEKDAVSHRGRAIEKLKAFLESTDNPNFDRTVKFNK
jgi:XTP/dITP diphosphohydrolase